MQTVNGNRIFNTTPHEIRFMESDGTIVIVPKGKVSDSVKANSTETLVSTSGKTMFVTPKFTPDDESLQVIEKAYNDGADIVVGSIIAAQAYPGKVFGMVPVEGYERATNDQKIMKSDTFVTY